MSDIAEVQSAGNNHHAVGRTIPSAKNNYTRERQWNKIEGFVTLTFAGFRLNWATMLFVNIAQDSRACVRTPSLWSPPRLDSHDHKAVPSSHKPFLPFSGLSKRLSRSANDRYTAHARI